MSERYSRLFALPENLYTVGSPVIIAAGTLLKDTQTGKIIAQLKLKSISAKEIKAVKVKLDLFDTAGNPLEDSVVYDYLDLNVSRDIEFGQKNPVMVPNAKTRSYKASVTEVVFDDRSVWTMDEEKWEPLSKPSLLVFDDPEMLRQYEIKFGKNSAYEPKVEKDLWHCTCGALNHDGEMCHICHNTLLALQTVDMAKLEDEKEARLAQQKAAAEAKLAEEKAATEAAKKKTAKIIKIAIPTICAIVAVSLLLYLVVIPFAKYNDDYINAISLMDDEKYKEAIAVFQTTDGYKDSEEKITECRYLAAIALMNEGQYKDAINAFNAMNGYEDSVQKISDCKDAWYQEALTSMNAGNIIEAYEAFIALNGYEDSTEKAASIYVQYEIEKIKAAKVSDIVVFGSYEEKALEWIVLDIQKNRVLLIGSSATFSKPYHENRIKVTWETCTLRKWLNDDFLNTAFSTEEQIYIPTVTVPEVKHLPYARAYAGNDTQDKVFILSSSEYRKYSAILDEHGILGFWLRTPGATNYNAALDYYDVGVSVSDRNRVIPVLWVDVG